MPLGIATHGGGFGGGAPANNPVNFKNPLATYSLQMPGIVGTENGYTWYAETQSYFWYQTYSTSGGQIYIFRISKINDEDWKMWYEASESTLTLGKTAVGVPLYDIDMIVLFQMAGTASSTKCISVFDSNFTFHTKNNTTLINAATSPSNVLAHYWDNTNKTLEVVLGSAATTPAHYYVKLNISNPASVTRVFEYTYTIGSAYTNANSGFYISPTTDDLIYLSTNSGYYTGWKKSTGAVNISAKLTAYVANNTGCSGALTNDNTCILFETNTYGVFNKLRLSDNTVIASTTASGMLTALAPFLPTGLIAAHTHYTASQCNVRRSRTGDLYIMPALKPTTGDAANFPVLYLLAKIDENFNVLGVQIIGYNFLFHPTAYKFNLGRTTNVIYSSNYKVLMMIK